MCGRLCPGARWRERHERRVAGRRHTWIRAGGGGSRPRARWRARHARWGRPTRWRWQAGYECRPRRTRSRRPGECRARNTGPTRRRVRRSRTGRSWPTTSRGARESHPAGERFRPCRPGEFTRAHVGRADARGRAAAGDPRRHAGLPSANARAARGHIGRVNARTERKAEGDGGVASREPGSLKDLSLCADRGYRHGKCTTRGPIVR